MILIEVVLATGEAERAAFVGLLRDTVAGSLAEEGCLAYRATGSLDDPLVFHLLEIWESEQAYLAHRQGETFARFLERLPQTGRVIAIERRAGTMEAYHPVQS
ncbi:putative quinol monooxygenase [Novosphingobium sp. BL-52-GroH]|uniref:putative quinol monooxygenase n=1 Tax=Novosphingobium sp. BL-52-GroH TaxID=3349877 RepID=UPI003850EF2B